MRQLTIVIDILDHDKAKWIWDNHLGNPSNGIKIKTICEGDCICECYEEIFKVDINSLSNREID